VIFGLITISLRDTLGSRNITVGSSPYRRLNNLESLGALVERLREGIYVTTRDGMILDANPAFLEMFGVDSLDEMRAFSAEDVLANPEQRRREVEILEREGSVRDFELIIRRPDGEERCVLDTAYAVTDESGRVFFHGVLIDITRLKELERRLHQMTLRDPLTGCFNRRYLTSLGANFDGTDSAWGVVVIDIDFFKAYNDRHDHQAGDRVLAETATYLKQIVRADDAVIRLGGDEFLLYLDGADQTVTEAIVNRLRAEGPDSAPVPISLGWAVRAGDEPLEKTVGRADRELMDWRTRIRDGEGDRPSLRT
jgi:diguanylate cyclase (GGDEF)-like protein/PAS domain S-box-containing protein